MKTVLVGISSRFIHSVLAGYYLKEYCPEFDIEVAEFNINMPYEELRRAILDLKADFIGFSCYIFNIEVIRKLLVDLKEARHGAKIILGGPEVSYEYEDYLPLCDFIVRGEGEIAFKQILESKIFNSSTPDSTGAIVIEGIKPDLAALPAPYTEYFINKVIRESNNSKIMYFESSRGCPYKCSFCMSSLSGGVRVFPLEWVKEQLRFLYSHHPKQIKFVDRTFNADISRAKEIIGFIIKMTAGDVSTNFHFEMSAEIVDEELIAVMRSAPAGLIQIEIGVQSFNERALESCDRAFDTEKLCRNLQKFMTLKNVHIHLDLIAGLPFEDFASFRGSVDKILEFSPDYLQIGFLKLLKGSKMRAEAAAHNMRYKSDPPYEIISNAYISEQELQKIRTAAAAAGAFYNKDRYKAILENLYPQYPNKFDLFYKIGCELEGGRYRKNILKDMYNLLFGFDIKGIKEYNN